MEQISGPPRTRHSHLSRKVWRPLVTAKSNNVNEPRTEPRQPGIEQQMHPKPSHEKESQRGFGKLDGKVALITGGDSGIGRAVAVAFAKEGADIAVSYLNERQDAEEPAVWSKRKGDAVFYCQAIWGRKSLRRNRPSD